MKGYKEANRSSTFMSECSSIAGNLFSWRILFKVAQRRLSLTKITTWLNSEIKIQVKMNQLTTRKNLYPRYPSNRWASVSFAPLRAWCSIEWGRAERACPCRWRSPSAGVQISMPDFHPIPEENQVSLLRQPARCPPRWIASGVAQPKSISSRNTAMNE